MKKTIEDLRTEIHKHNYNYYVLDNPTITDYDYDLMLKKLEILERQFPEFNDLNSPTMRVGSDHDQKFTQKNHSVPMLSLANTYNRTEIEEFDLRIKKVLDEYFEYVCELKYDGASLSLTYIDGELVEAITRGDGKAGDDVTVNARCIKSIPLKLYGAFPKKITIRGEVVMTHESFQQANIDRITEGEESFSNPRNAASGTLKNGRSSVVAKRNLLFNPYFITDDSLGDNHHESMLKLKDFGFNVHPLRKVCKNLNEVFTFIERVEGWKPTLKFDIDGVVIKINSKKQYEELGIGTKYPNGAFAYKYPAEQVSTILEKVIYQVGRTGAITPVALFKPTAIGGTSTKRATLHNKDIMDKLNLHIGDEILIQRCGEVIPGVVGVKKSNPTGKEMKFPIECPNCKQPLSKKDVNDKKTFCTNDNCSSRNILTIIHFASKKAMDIDGCADATVEALFDAGLVTKIEDLYYLKTDDIAGIGRLGEKSADNLITAIQESKSKPFEKILYGLGIHCIGEVESKKLVDKYQNIQALSHATKESLMQIDGFGEKMSDAVIDYFKKQENIDTIVKLHKSGLKLKAEEKQFVSQKLTGLEFCITGTLSKSREEIAKIITDNGGKENDGVTKTTTYLVVGEKPGKSKVDKVGKKGYIVKTINEIEFNNLLK